MTGALLALLVGGLSTNPEARAGCSHYSIPRDREAGVSARFEMLGRAGALATSARAPSGERPGRPAPCSGAMCSGRPNVPLLPAPSNPGPRGAWAILECPLLLSGPDSVSTEFDDPAPRPLRAGAAIFHPPRTIPRHLAS